MSHFYTRVAYTRLTEELNRLRSEELPSVSRAKQEAAAEGDLSENAEYHATRERLDMLQRRIYELEEQLRAPAPMLTTRSAGGWPVSACRP